jgi:hypothetical protein
MTQLSPSRARTGRTHWGLLLLFVLALLLTLLFALRLARHARLARGPAEVRPWMSLPHIARSHRVPLALLNETAGLPPDAFDRRPLLDLAREQGRPVRTLIADLEAVITLFERAPEPPLPNDPPRPTPEPPP